MVSSNGSEASPQESHVSILNTLSVPQKFPVLTDGFSFSSSEPWGLSHFLSAERNPVRETPQNSTADRIIKAILCHSYASHLFWKWGSLRRKNVPKAWRRENVPRDTFVSSAESLYPLLESCLAIVYSCALEFLSPILRDYDMASVSICTKLRSLWSISFFSLKVVVCMIIS
jgi:hypothetical protein